MAFSLRLGASNRCLSMTNMLHREVFAVFLSPWEGLRKFAMVEIAGHIIHGPERPETDEMSHHANLLYRGLVPVQIVRLKRRSVKAVCSAIRKAGLCS